MANEEHVTLLKQGADIWNNWRRNKRKMTFGVVDLCGANLRGADLSGAFLVEEDLSGADLSEANLSDANLSKAILSDASLSGANLSRAILPGADLNDSTLQKANLNGANLTHAYLWRANLIQAKLKQAKLGGANLYRADLSEADLSSAKLMYTDLTEANLSGATLCEAYLGSTDLCSANFSGADLSGANLSRADLSNADLSGANLSRANLIGAQLSETNLEKANLSGCSVYGISAWKLKLEGANQANLVITPPDEPAITVDNLEVAQFIYLLLNNQKIREVIDTITSKVVLILGRFTPERKKVLDAIREKLHEKYDYVPVMFDFNKPDSQDFIETVSTLAHMARFVIADCTESKIVLEEVPHIVRNIAVPVVPLLLEGSGEEPVTLYNLRRNHRSLLDTYRYKDNIDNLLASLEEKVIGPAEKAREVLELG